MTQRNGEKKLMSSVDELTGKTGAELSLENHSPTGIDMEWFYAGQCGDEKEKSTLKPPATWVSVLLQRCIRTLKVLEEDRAKFGRSETMKSEEMESSHAWEDDGVCDRDGERAARRCLKYLGDQLEFLSYVMNSFAWTKDWPKTVDHVREVTSMFEAWQSLDILDSFVDSNASGASLDPLPASTAEEALSAVSSASLATSDTAEEATTTTTTMTRSDAKNEVETVCEKRMESETSVDVMLSQDSFDLPALSTSSSPTFAPSPFALSSLSPSSPTSFSFGMRGKLSAASGVRAKTPAKNNIVGPNKRRRRNLVLPKKFRAMHSSAVGKGGEKAGSRATALPADPVNVVEKNQTDERFHFVNQVVKQFLCKRCNQIFSRSDSYRRHIRSAHLTSDKKYVCVICGLSSPRVDNVKKHLKRIHDLESGKVNVRDFIIETPLNVDDVAASADRRNGNGEFRYLRMVPWGPSCFQSRRRDYETCHFRRYIC